ncbi:anthranilate phosphoribosyltransferase, partial [Streptomyces rimosus]
MTEPQTAPTWPGDLGALLARRDLPADSTAWALDQVMSGRASSAQLAAFLVALRAKGETAGEITGLVRAMYAHAVPL